VGRHTRDICALDALNIQWSFQRLCW